MDQLLFLRKFIDDPRHIGSIAPSSDSLTQKMLGGLDWENFHYVAELGTGTGVFTQYIMQHKRLNCKFLGIEQDYEMRQNLQEKYPEIYWGAQAENLCAILKKYNFPQLDCVISGLPFAVLDKSVRLQIMENVTQSLAPGGIFVAFQYSLQMRSTLKKYFDAVKIEFTLFNLPPAFIYFCHNN